MIVSGLKSCDSTRAALKALRAAGLSPEFRDFREVPPERAEVARWFGALGPGLVNRASTTWRGLDDAEKGAEAVALLLRHPTLVKRPVIEYGDRLSMGWKADARTLWLG